MITLHLAETTKVIYSSTDSKKAFDEARKFAVENETVIEVRGYEPPKEEKDVEPSLH